VGSNLLLARNFIPYITDDTRPKPDCLSNVSLKGAKNEQILARCTFRTDPDFGSDCLWADNAEA
jgi:hypothetical protein